MKIRQGFVSNSSSSSFICDVCGENESGFDMCLSDAEMYECINGHYFCISHALTNYSVKDLYKDELARLEKEIVNSGNDKRYREHHKSLRDELIKDFNNIESDGTGKNEFRERYQGEDGGPWGMTPLCCPICQNLKYENNELIMAIVDRFGWDKKDLLQVVKEYREKKQ